ncbi:MAG TPA: TonB C-terminal domain-containing protein [Nitrospirae bacterium]|nr:gram-negative bacterial tonB protein [bacterium BMS3Bbin08]HDK16791.1 TonB C-terminal domain-containing protein [Nitrospirota bacterium]
MKRSLHIGTEPSLQKIVIASAVLHLLFIALIIIPIKTKEREFRSYQVKLVGPVLASRADTGRTPSRKRRTRKIPPKKIVRTPPKADMTLEKTGRLTKEIERLRAISALSKKKKKTAEKAEEIEVVKKGAGIPGEGVSTDSDPYYSLITEKIWSQWVYPDFDTDLEVIIAIRIDKDGKIISQEIEKTSGNRLFDRSALKAISKAGPLPPPPAEMEIGIRFHL